jgi:tetratricopeptide (TPR) repeat protein
VRGQELTQALAGDARATEPLREKTLLFHEMNRVTDDMESNYVEQQSDWRDWQRLQQRTVTGMPLKSVERTWSASTFGASGWDNLTSELFGVSQEFLGFFRPSLLVALIVGMVALLAGLHLAAGAAAPFGRELLWGLGFAVFFLAVPIVPRSVGEYYLVEAERALARGEAKDAGDCLAAAPSWKWALRRSWSYHAQLGHLSSLRDDQISPEKLLADAYANLRGGHPRAALELLYRVQQLAPDHAVLPEFLGVTLAEAGIGAFNGGEYTLAKEYWEESLAYIPINPTPWHGLSLVYFRERRFDQAARCGEQIVKLQSYLGFKRLTVRSQAFVAKSWAALQQGDNAQAHEMYSLSLTPERW